ncbi:MAG: CHASE2 domain-containing protein [Chlorobi bacterium CHB2]|nr:CHASE2 domain-containing protein [Chlorobi bacterium CHB2]
MDARRWGLILAAAVGVAIFSQYSQDLPQFDVVEVAMNDQNFTDLVLQTRGELPIDTNIRVLTYDRTLFDSTDRVDRAVLATRLAAVLDLKPAIVAVDFLLEDERPESPDGDAMLAALIEAHPNLMFGIFYEDSLKQFRIPPPLFKLNGAQLGCINLQPDDDKTIRTYTVLWGQTDSVKFESFDVKIARAIDSNAAAVATSFSQKTFVIDYAGGIGEESEGDNGGGKQIFPTIPLEAVFAAAMQGESGAVEAFRQQLAGKAVLVGYADIRNSQITSIVDRFFTPLKNGKNALPDMHGVGIHANIVNTMLQGRVVEVVAPYVNIMVGIAIATVFLLLRSRVSSVRRPTLRTISQYSLFFLFLFSAVLLPVLAFRYTTYKFSIYTPFTAVLLAIPTFELLQKGIELSRDISRRRRAKKIRLGWLREQLFDILQAGPVEQQYMQALHFLRLQFHLACAALFHEAVEQGTITFPSLTIASPTPQRMFAGIRGQQAQLQSAGADARHGAAIIEIMAHYPRIVQELRLSRSFYIALNEVRRQTAAGAATAANPSDGSAPNAPPTGEETSAADYIDLALTALTGEGGSRKNFEALYAEIEQFAAKAEATLMEEARDYQSLLEHGPIFYPYTISCRCRLHGTDELFIYFNEQEDTNERDDYFDLVYGGRTIRCQPAQHPGLTEVRNYRLRIQSDG